ncbi:MAG: Flp pilus assembly complex ATPase component TadA, partial [Candidatus Omnitrophica bacterium]|nr:Flp pilus assembly complex ATPase component TadA [Candidatus Omnitrophota bacterium]
MEQNTALRQLLLLTIEKGASDLHLTENTPPVLRIDGALVKTDLQTLTAEELKQIIFEILSPTQRKQFEDTKELDFSLAMTGLDRFRVNVHIQRGCVEAAFRRVSLFIPSAEELQLPPIVGDLARKQDGLVLITGATGTGKSTTMASMIDLINQERACVIISVEDPIEYVHSNKKSIIKQREV